MAQCIATSKRSGNQCRRDAINGATVCQIHGGAAPQVKAAAARRLAERNLNGQIGKLLEELRDQPTPPLIDGLEAAVDHCARMVVALRFVATGRDALGVNRFGEQVPDPAVAMYGEWVDRYARATKLALDAGIDERRTRLSELDAGVLFDAIGNALITAGLSVEQQQAFRSALATGLRAIETSAA